MGNKDSRGREKKKPKQKTPKYVPPKRDATQPAHVINVVNPEKPPAGS